jgi:uncharacterized protein (TIGR02270 family)
VVIPTLVARHAEEAAFLWSQRDNAANGAAYTLKALARLDERVDAHLDGLRIAGDTGWTLCRVKLEDAGPGEVFALSVLAFGAGDRTRMREALTVGAVSAELRRGLVSALGWLDYQAIAPWIMKLLPAQAAVHRAVGVAALAVHRADPGGAFDRMLSDPDPIVRARALRAVGELKLRALLAQVREHLADEDEASRFWAAWSLTMHRHPDGLKSLTEWIKPAGPFRRAAVQLSFRAMSVEEGRSWIRTLANDAELLETAVLAAGALGDPASIGWLISTMRVPELSRAAGGAFSMITGVDLEDLNFDEREQEPAVAESDETAVEKEGAAEAQPEEGLPKPRPDLLEAWWHDYKDAFAPGARYLAGQPVSPRAIHEVLVSGRQHQRAAAAIELALRDPDQKLFEVRGGGRSQVAVLQARG